MSTVPDENIYEYNSEYNSGYDSDTESDNESDYCDIIPDLPDLDMYNFPSQNMSKRRRYSYPCSPYSRRQRSPSLPKPIQLARLTCNCVSCTSPLLGDSSIECSQKWRTEKDLQLYFQKKRQEYDRYLENKFTEDLIALKERIDNDLANYVDLPTESKAFREKRLSEENKKNKKKDVKKPPQRAKFSHRRNGGGKKKKNNGPDEETIKIRRAEKRKARKIALKEGVQSRKEEFAKSGITRTTSSLVIIKEYTISEDNSSGEETDNEEEEDNQKLREKMMGYFNDKNKDTMLEYLTRKEKEKEKEVETKTEIIEEWKVVTTKSKIKKNKICPYFIMGQKCKKQSKCTFVHKLQKISLPKTNISSTSNNFTVVCKSLNTEIKCKDENKCKFAHTKEQFVITNCFFGQDCVYVNLEGALYYNTKEKICCRRHTNETDENLYSRLNLVSKPQSEAKTIPILKKSIQTKKHLPGEVWSKIIKNDHSIVSIPQIPETKRVESPTFEEVKIQKKADAICKYYKAGQKCPHISCRFIHNDEMDIPNSEFKNSYISAIDILSNKNKIAIKKKYTKMCESVNKGINCRHGSSCRFAHSKDQLIISNCFFGDDCKNIKLTGESGYINITKNICPFKHPNETLNEFYTRTN